MLSERDRAELDVDREKATPEREERDAGRLGDGGLSCRWLGDVEGRIAASLERRARQIRTGRGSIGDGEMRVMP